MGAVGTGIGSTGVSGDLLAVAPRRKLMGWVMFLGFIALNETRGVYVVAQFLRAYQRH